ncbi:hypothetical protein ACWD25_26770, partial [Streptomyces sp. NPDC002920]
MERDPLLWAALVAVLTVLTSAEYELAVACGFGTYVAAGVPAATWASITAETGPFTVASVTVPPGSGPGFSNGT